MLAIPPQGLHVFSNSPSPDIHGNTNCRQIMFITLNDQILSQIQTCGGKGLSIKFGPTSVSLLVSKPFLYTLLVFCCPSAIAYFLNCVHHVLISSASKLVIMSTNSPVSFQKHSLLHLKCIRETLPHRMPHLIY